MMTPQDIKTLRFALRVPAWRFAELCDVSENTIYRWESGDRHPTYENLVRLNELSEKAAKDGTIEAAAKLLNGHGKGK